MGTLNGFHRWLCFVAVADTLDNAHHILKDMMEHPNGGLDWSQNHNLPFELSILAVMDFTRIPRDIVLSPLHIVKVNPDDTTMLHNITTVMDYKYLGIIFNPKQQSNH